MRDRLAAFVTGRVFLPLAILLVGIRFAAPTVTAYLGVLGIDTTALDGAFEFYAGILPAVLLPLAALVVLSWPAGISLDVRLLLAAALTAVAAVLWLGELSPSLRVLWTPWSSAILGAVVAGAIGFFLWALEKRLWTGHPDVFARDAFRAVGLGFAIAYLMRSLRLVDYRAVLGASAPTGVQWLLDYGPVLLLSFLSILYWFSLAVSRARETADRVRVLLPPVATALVGVGASQGVGGFILSNALTWGGSYPIFVIAGTTAVSLALVGFAIGAFLATAWVLRARLRLRTWRLLTGGVAIVALAGILTFAGAFPSLSGILLGLASVARGLRDRAVPSMGGS